MNRRTDPVLKDWEVWIEGYWCEPECEGKPRPHRYIGTYRAEDFRNACHIAAMHMADGDLPTFYHYYDINHNDWWGCRFFDNEKDAAEAYG